MPRHIHSRNKQNHSQVLTSTRWFPLIGLGMTPFPKSYHHHIKNKDTVFDSSIPDLKGPMNLLLYIVFAEKQNPGISSSLIDPSIQGQGKRKNLPSISFSTSLQSFRIIRGSKRHKQSQPKRKRKVITREKCSIHLNASKKSRVFTFLPRSNLKSPISILRFLTHS